MLCPQLPGRVSFSQPGLNGYQKIPMALIQILGWEDASREFLGSFSLHAWDFPASPSTFAWRTLGRSKLQMSPLLVARIPVTELKLSTRENHSSRCCKAILDHSLSALVVAWACHHDVAVKMSSANAPRQTVDERAPYTS